MQRSRKRLEEALRCHLAANICKMVRRYRLSLSQDTIVYSCKYVSYLCKDKCPDAAMSCFDAFFAIREGNEDEYLEFCSKACEDCELTVVYRKQMEQIQEKLEESIKKDRRNNYTV